ncbi:10879_t:CDS:2 [Cetraspora pellucida]|uniref:10879_t:CDS:1 n=1 Tax=Cetraspora pellucida TaxID=1433469 RepID=A0ACA9K587_9GLOM|nr:10879_t:CDS:2 [Cetraspora pellucida]
MQVDLVLKSHYMITISLAGIGWIVLLGGAGAITALYDNTINAYSYGYSSASSRMSGVFATLWLYVIYQFVVITGLFMMVAKNAIRQYRLAVLSFIIISFISNCNFAFMATVSSGMFSFSLLDVHSKINALIAGLSILAIANFIWIIIIGSEDDSTLIRNIDGYYGNIRNEKDSTGNRFAPQPTPMYTSDFTNA